MTILPFPWKQPDLLKNVRFVFTQPGFNCLKKSHQILERLRSTSLAGGSFPTHLKSMLVKLGSSPKPRGEKLKIWGTTTQQKKGFNSRPKFWETNGFHKPCIRLTSHKIQSFLLRQGSVPQTWSPQDHHHHSWPLRDWTYWIPETSVFSTYAKWEAYGNTHPQMLNL